MCLLRAETKAAHFLEDLEVNWYYRVLAQDDPNVDAILAGADLTPVAPLKIPGDAPAAIGGLVGGAIGFVVGKEQAERSYEGESSWDGL